MRGDNGEVGLVITAKADRVRAALDRADSPADAADEVIRSMKRVVEDSRVAITRRLIEIDAAHPSKGGEG